MVFLDDALQKDLHPSRHTHNDADVPLGGSLHHQVHLFAPVLHLRNLLSGLVERLEPRRNLARRNARKVASIVAELLIILQVGAAANHQDATIVESHRKIVARGRNQLADACAGDFVVQALGNGDVFRGRLGCARTEREILDFARPCDVALALQVEVPPLVVHLVVVEHGDAPAVFLQDVGRQQNLVKMIEFSELRELCLHQQLAQLAPLRTNRVGVVLTDFDRYILDFRCGLHQSTHNGNGHVSSSNNR